jgi:hypothetical protein
MKTLLLSISLTLISFTIRSQITRQEAINTVINEIVGVDSLEIHHLYSRYQKMYQNDTLWLDGLWEYYLAPYEENWVFFVDLAPPAYWAHDCEIIFLNVSTGEYIVNYDDWPPDPFLGGMTQFFEDWEWILSVGTETKGVSNTKYFNIYPNPFSDEISIAYDDQINEALLIKIIDITGKTVFMETGQAEPAKNGILRINTKNIEAGLYFVQISGNNQVLYIGKIIK